MGRQASSCWTLQSVVRPLDFTLIVKGRRAPCGAVLYMFISGKFHELSAKQVLQSG